MLQYVYLLREREFIRLNESTYKIGKTTQEPHKRFANYPKGSEVLLFVAVEDCHRVERRIIDHFRANFQHRPEYGSEYFQGEPKAMLAAIFSIIQEAAVPAIYNSPPSTTDESSVSDDENDGFVLDLSNPLLDPAPPKKEVAADAPADVLKFGKHRGMKLSDIKILDEQYLRWLLRALHKQPEENQNLELIEQLVDLGIEPLPPGNAAKGRRSHRYRRD